MNVDADEVRRISRQCPKIWLERGWLLGSGWQGFSFSIKSPKRFRLLSELGMSEEVPRSSSDS